MNPQLQRRQDEFRADEEKDAWQQGYISSVEVLMDLLQDLPETLHGALCAGWWCAFEDTTKRASSRGRQAQPSGRASAQQDFGERSSAVLVVAGGAVNIEIKTDPAPADTPDASGS